MNIRYLIKLDVDMFTLFKTLLTRGVSHCGLAIYIKKYLKVKEELWKFKIFHHAKV